MRPQAQGLRWLQQRRSGKILRLKSCKKKAIPAAPASPPLFDAAALFAHVVLDSEINL
jgi:hypothetical protein